VLTAADAVELRPATPEDEAFLRALDAATQPAGLPPQLVDLQFSARRQARAQLVPAARHEVVLRGGRPVGEQAVQETGAQVHLVDLALLPAERGQGVGARLLADLQRRAGSRPVRLSVLAGSPARRLYERAGFRVTGTDGAHEHMEWTRPAAADEVGA
jgi:ribosomal protein S18 acetylase RimI-like enzyme